MAALEAAVANADPKTPVGEAVSGGETASSTGVAADLDAIRASLVAKRYAILQRTDASLTVQIKRARATIVLDQHGGAIRITPFPSTTVAPGKCVAVPEVTYVVDANGRATNDAGESSESSTHWRLTTQHFLDVDGDGIPDAVVPQPASKTECPGLVMWRVYVMRGTCGHDLGLVGPDEPKSGGPLGPAGFRPLVTESVTTRRGAGGIPDHVTITNRFAVSHGAYARIDTQQRVGVCHHCALWHCTSP